MTCAKVKPYYEITRYYLINTSGLLDNVYRNSMKDALSAALAAGSGYCADTGRLVVNGFVSARCSLP